MTDYRDLPAIGYSQIAGRVVSQEFARAERIGDVLCLHSCGRCGRCWHGLHPSSTVESHRQSVQQNNPVASSDGLAKAQGFLPRGSRAKDSPAEQGGCELLVPVARGSVVRHATVNIRSGNPALNRGLIQ